MFFTFFFSQSVFFWNKQKSKKERGGKGKKRKEKSEKKVMWFRHKSILYLGGVIGGVACNYPFFLINTRPLSFFSHIAKSSGCKKKLSLANVTPLSSFDWSVTIFIIFCVWHPPTSWQCTSFMETKSIQFSLIPKVKWGSWSLSPWFYHFFIFTLFDTLCLYI